MWPRIVEAMLACWLALSPFVFRYGEDEHFLWFNAFAGAAAILLLSLTSLAKRFDKLHLGLLAVAAWLAAPALAGIGTEPPPPALQNQLMVAFLISMLAVLPSRSHLPPRAWQDFNASQTADREGD